jgi:tetratricopeptide (TPR) repeat protein
MFALDLEPRLDLANLSEWAPEALDAISSFKEEAVLAFSAGDYNQAIGVIRKAEVIAKETLVQWEENFSENYLASLSHFGNNESDVAGLKIDKALVFKPTDPAALKLRQRIDVLPKVRDLLSEARVAKIENNPRKEYRALSEILGVDPQRTELRSRIRALEAEISEENFNLLIQKGFGAVDDRDLRQARSYLNSALDIYPDRGEGKNLRDKVERLGEEVALETALAEAKQAISRDDWPGALVIFQKAIKSHPDDGYLVDQTMIASKIVSLSKAIAGFVAMHQRLSSRNVFLLAERALKEVSEIADRSSSLSVKSNKLRGFLGEYDRPVDVVVRSDNHTHISVRGVGEVGVVEKKSIRLKPGVYTFEGKRSGFRSRLLNVEIGLYQTSVDVELICNEQI